MLSLRDVMPYPGIGCSVMRISLLCFQFLVPIVKIELKKTLNVFGKIQIGSLRVESE